MENEMVEDIIQRLKKDKRSINQIAKDADLLQPTLSRFINGHLMLSGDKLMKLVVALGGSIKWEKKRK